MVLVWLAVISSKIQKSLEFWLKLETWLQISKQSIIFYTGLIMQVLRICVTQSRLVQSIKFFDGLLHNLAIILIYDGIQMWFLQMGGTSEAIQGVRCLPA